LDLQPYFMIILELTLM